LRSFSDSCIFCWMASATSAFLWREVSTSRFIEDNNYLTLSSLNISYEFGADVLRKLSIDRLKFSLIGNELFRSSTVKMERGLTYPFARTFTFAMQVSF